MPLQSCLICASDEGIFLDIFSNDNFRDNIETCLSLKARRSNLSSTKICHKCAYELDQCSKFVKKCKKTQIQNGRLYKKHGHCCLCMEPGKDGLIFDLVNENPLNNPQEKIHRLFNIDFIQKNFANLSICLDCRYNLDVLFDLKCILHDNSDHLKKFLSGKTSSPKIEKIKTNVVKRKTTSVNSTPAELSKVILSDMDSDTSSISENISTQRSSNRSHSIHCKRQCEECLAKIPIGDDMFRYHISGITVCKQCWLKMDPSDRNYGKKQKVSTETKHCCVFLKDILTSSDDKPTTIEKEDNSDSIYTISDDSTIDESSSSVKKNNTKSKRKSNQRDSNLLKKPKNDINVRKSSRLRASSVQNEHMEKKVLRSSRAKSVEVVHIISNPRLSEKKSLSDSNRSKSQKKTKKKSQFNSSSETVNQTNSSNVISRTRKRTRNQSNSSISSIEEKKLSKTPKKMNKLNSRKAESDCDNSRPYTCNICHNDFDNRVEGLTHELTHSKSLEVVLKKVSLTGNTDTELNKNETEQNDEVTNIINDVNNKEKTDRLNLELLREEKVDKLSNKDDQSEIDHDTLTTNSTSKECENDTTDKIFKNNTKTNDEKDDNDTNISNNEKCKINDSDQNNSSNSVKSKSDNEPAVDDNNHDGDDQLTTEKDQNEEEDSLIVVDVSTDSDIKIQNGNEKDITETCNNNTCTDDNVDNAKCESDEIIKKANGDVGENSFEENTEANSICDAEKLKDFNNDEKKEANEKIESVIDSKNEDNYNKTIDNNNDNDDNSEKKKEDEKNEDEERNDEEKKNDEEKENDKEKEIKCKREKKINKPENVEESPQCIRDQAANDFLINNKNDVSSNNENLDNVNKNGEQILEETVEADKNSNSSKKDEKENISDDEGALIEQEMEKIKNHMNNPKQVDQEDIDVENIENSVELTTTGTDNMSISELEIANSENGEKS